MKSIKTKIQISMLSAVLVSAVLIGVITALLNASGIDAVMEKTMLPATQMAADAVEWHMDKYWTALQEAAASDIFRESEPTAPELIPVRDDIAQRNGFLYTGKMDADGFSSTGFSYAGEEYFQMCKQSMKPYISDIMNDGQQMIFLLEVPIIEDGQFAGAVYGGISADFLSDIVVNLAMGNDGVAYVLDHNGNVIGHRERAIVEEGSNMINAAKTDASLEDVAALNQRGKPAREPISCMAITNLWGLPPLTAIRNGALPLKPASGNLSLPWIEAFCSHFWWCCWSFLPPALSQ